LFSCVEAIGGSNIKDYSSAIDSCCPYEIVPNPDEFYLHVGLCNLAAALRP
jgi:hypothetical protein